MAHADGAGQIGLLGVGEEADGLGHPPRRRPPPRAQLAQPKVDELVDRTSHLEGWTTAGLETDSGIMICTRLQPST